MRTHQAPFGVLPRPLAGRSIASESQIPTKGFSSSSHEQRPGSAIPSCRSCPLKVIAKNRRHGGVRSHRTPPILNFPPCVFISARKHPVFAKLRTHEIGFPVLSRHIHSENRDFLGIFPKTTCRSMYASVSDPQPWFSGRSARKTSLTVLLQNRCTGAKSRNHSRVGTRCAERPAHSPGLFAKFLVLRLRCRRNDISFRDTFRNIFASCEW